MAPFWRKKKGKKKGEGEGYRETRKQLHDGRVLLGLGVQSEQQLQQLRVTAEAKVEFHRRFGFCASVESRCIIYSEGKSDVHCYQSIKLPFSCDDMMP